MKKNIALLASVLLLASCSAPKYTYHFDHYDYNSGRKKAMEEKALLADNASITEGIAVTETVLTTESPLAIGKEAVTASRNDANAVQVPASTSSFMDKSALEKKYSEMSRSEKKEFRKELKTAVKKYVKAKKEGTSVSAVKALDYNLKMAIIFGAVALTLSFFGGVNSVFWIISVVALVIGVVFFIKWIAEQ